MLGITVALGAPALADELRPQVTETVERLERIEELWLDTQRSMFDDSVDTEITDLEGELNGFLTYDRQVVKMDQARVRAADPARRRDRRRREAQRA